MLSSLKVVVYSYTAAWVAGIFQIIPALAILAILGLYSLYLLYLGLNIVKGSPSDKVLGYTAVVVIITIIIYFIIGTIVSAIALGGLMFNAMKGY